MKKNGSMKRQKKKKKLMNVHRHCIPVELIAYTSVFIKKKNQVARDNILILQRAIFRRFFFYFLEIYI